MTKDKLKQDVDELKQETREALQTVVDELNKGQRQKIVKNPKVKELLDRYGVKFG